MLSSIQISPGGSEAPVSPSAAKAPGPHSNSDPFGLVMNQALARNPEDPSSDLSPAIARQGTAPAPDADAAPRPLGPGARPATNRSLRKSSRAPSQEQPHAISDHGAALIASVPATPAPVPLLQPTFNLTGSTESQDRPAPIPSATNAIKASGEASPRLTPPETEQGDDAKAPNKAPVAPAALNDSRMQSPSTETRPTAASPAPQVAIHDEQQTDNLPTTPDHSAERDSPAVNISSPDSPATPATTAGVPSPTDTPAPGTTTGIQVGAPAFLPNGPPGQSPGDEFAETIGTSVAQEEPSMKKAEKEPKTADPSQQNLPGDGAVTADHARSEALQPSANLSANFEKLSLATNQDHANNNTVVTEPSVSNAANTSGTPDARLASLERTHDLVAMHALRLTQSGTDSLRVVLEPGGGTRLSLELRFNNGGIQAQALLHRGDFQFLSSHWPELQQRLEPRGVHLGTLECSDQSNPGQERFQHSGQQPPDEQQLTPSAFAQFALDGAMADPPTGPRSRATTHVGWETWA
jgi:hypothetical protein